MCFTNHKVVKHTALIERFSGHGTDRLSICAISWGSGSRLTLTGIPAEAHGYRLGNRSALDWVIDQYRVERAKDDPDSVLSDPNRADDEEYIVRLVGQVVTVSVETMKLVQSLPTLGDGAPAAGYTQADLDAAHIYVGEDKPEDA